VNRSASPDPVDNGRRPDLPRRRRLRRIGRTLASALLLLGLGTRPAAALLGDTLGSFGLEGSLRSVVLGAANYDEPALFGDHDTDLFTQTLARFVVAGRPSAVWGYELHLLQTLSSSSAVAATSTGGAGLPGGAAAGDLRYRALDLTWEQDDEGDWQRALGLDRAAVSLALGPLDLTVGRQAVTFGKTFFWSPMDVFAPFDPRQLDRDYKPGIDALRTDLALGDLSGLVLVAAAGRSLDTANEPTESGFAELSWYGSALFARAFTTLGGWDLAVQGGKVYGGWHAGFGVVGEVAGVDIRGEVVQFLAEDSPALAPGLLPDSERQVEDATSVVVGVGRRFESSLDLHAEYFLNGGGDGDALEASFLRVSGGTLLSASRHLLGVSASYEMTPLVTATLGWIVSLEDGSGQVLPSLVWSLSDDAELVVGLFVAHGKRPESGAFGVPRLRSEFGTYPSYLYVEPKIYF
jgi:hypothetical protein